MIKLSKFEELLYEFESPSVSKKQIDKLLQFLKNDHVYNALFDSYISRRLKSNIHPERLLSMAYNLEKNDGTKYLSESINARVADSITRNNESFDQFYYMNRHDTRTDNHILKSVIERIGDRLDTSVMELVGKIAPNIKMDKHLLLLKAIGSVEFGSFRATLFMERISVEDQYMLAVRAFEEGVDFASKLIRFSNKALYDYTANSISQNGDQDQLISAIRNSTIEIDKIEYNDFLHFLLSRKGEHIPATLGRLYARAEKEGRFEYLLNVCAHKNKKDVLRTICQAKDKELIDKFFSIYKDHPEVKHLAPFL